MLVRYGIVCNRCRKLHFIPSDWKSSRIRYDRKRSEFLATCVAPCANTIYFQRGMLTPYLVPDQAVQQGYAHLDDCLPAATKEKE